MREGTSGFWLEEGEMGIAIGYEDYGVDELGGADFEVTYRLDCNNAPKFKEALARRYKGTLEEMIEAAFGREFCDSSFREFCRIYTIRYSKSTWTSYPNHR